MKTFQVIGLVVLLTGLAGCGPELADPPTATLDPSFLTSDPPWMADLALTLTVPPAATLAPTETPTATATVKLREAPPTTAFDACLLLTPVEVHNAITPYNPNTFGQPPDPDSLPVPVNTFEVDPQRQSVTGTCDYGRMLLTLYLPGPYDDLDALMAAEQEDKGFEPQGEANERFAEFWSQENATLSYRMDDRWITMAFLSPSGERPNTTVEYNQISMLKNWTFPRMHDVLAGVYPSPTPYFNACDVMSVEQVESIIGPLATDPLFSAAIGEDVGPVEECIFEGALNVVYVQVQRWDTPENAHESFLHWTGGAGEAVPGIGEEALWDVTLLRLSARRGTVTLHVTMNNPDGARDQAIQIAQIAVVRIP